MLTRYECPWCGWTGTTPGIKYPKPNDADVYFCPKCGVFKPVIVLSPKGVDNNYPECGASTPLWAAECSVCGCVWD